MAIRHGYTATGINDGTKQVSVDRWNQDHVVDESVILPDANPLTPPPADTVAVFGRKLAGRMMLAQMGPSGLDTIMQPHLGGNKTAMWMPPGNQTNVPGLFGMAALTPTGTATARTVATTNLLTRMTRLGFVSAATAGALAGAREAFVKFTVGAGGGLGGFHYRARFGVSDAANVAGARMFLGLLGSTGAPTNVEIDTLVNAIGVCQLSSSGNLHAYCAGASVGTPIDLGALFPARAGSLDAYELSLFAPAGGGVVGWQVTRLNTGDFARGTFSTNIPSGTQLLCMQAWRGNNSTALAVGLDICGIHMETDF